MMARPDNYSLECNVLEHYGENATRQSDVLGETTQLASTHSKEGEKKILNEANGAMQECRYHLCHIAERVSDAHSGQIGCTIQCDAGDAIWASRKDTNMLQFDYRTTSGD
jgi:hypothetical protein